MGRSFLSIKLAAVFGLLVAAAVSVQEQALERGGVPVQEAIAVDALLPLVEVTDERSEHKCAGEVTHPARTPRATAHAPRAGAAKRS